MLTLTSSRITCALRRLPFTSLLPERRGLLCEPCDAIDPFSNEESIDKEESVDGKSTDR